MSRPKPFLRLKYSVAGVNAGDNNNSSVRRKATVAGVNDSSLRRKATVASIVQQQQQQHQQSPKSSLPDRIVAGDKGPSRKVTRASPLAQQQPQQQRLKEQSGEQLLEKEEEEKEPKMVIFKGGGGSSLCQNISGQKIPRWFMKHLKGQNVYGFYFFFGLLFLR